MKPFFRLTFAFLLASTSLAQHNPLKDANICGRPTCLGTGKFKYDSSTQQNYKYSVSVRSLFNGTSKNESGLYIEGLATLNFLTPCDGLLTLNDVKLREKTNHHEDFSEHGNAREFGESISAYTLRFSFNDGIISEICPQNDEKNWVLNFKRGLLSMLQNTMKRFDLDHSTTEEDVKGNCPTQYVVKGAKETSLLIEKTQNLALCQNRAKLHSMVQSVPYNFRSELQEEKNLLKSSSKCELSIDHHIYNEITCEESHILQPFSNQDAGATTIVVQRLILLDENVATLGEQSEITRRTSLLFDHIPSPKPTNDELKASKDLIKQMCKQSTDDVQIQFSDLFTKFIQTLRLLSYPSLSDLYGHVGTLCPTAKKHLLDALPYVRSTAAVIVMKDIILKGGINQDTSNEWLMSLAFIRQPNDEMMNAANELLKRKSFNASIAFSVTSLAHTYCAKGKNCIDNPSVSSILGQISQTIIDLYLKHELDQYDQDKLVVALKSLGNIGVVSDETQNYLTLIIEDSQIDSSIRVAAVEVYRRLPCSTSRNYFEYLFKNQNEDVEVRIASYLQIMSCPNYLLIQTIRQCLENEEVNQVGSFVWTHLNNLMKSSIPSRVEVQGLLSDINLVKKFSSDVRKFSHHREGSIFFEDYNFGANYDSNLIFSPSSYVPKSAMLNFTVDVFGESINFLELNARLQGFEHYLESLFGPKGSYNSNKLKEKVTKMRWSRSAEDNVNQNLADISLKENIDKLPNVVENSNKPKVSLGLKVFGNELKYATFNGDKEIKAALQTLNPVDHLKRILSGKEINYNKAAMFLDSQYVVPTGAGLPISLKALGTASIKLKLSGSLHAANFAKNKELDLKADIRPSISLDLTGVMLVDAFYTSSGIKLKSSMYTSSAIEGNIKIRSTKLVSVKFSIPRQTSEIFGAKSELVVIQHDVEQVQSGLSQYLVAKSMCSWPAVEKTIGLKLCAEYYFINVTKISNIPHFALAGPSEVRLFLQKSDPTAKIYLFEYKWTDKKDLSIVSFSFDTPDSQLKHLLSANFTIDKQSQNLTLVLKSTEGTVMLKGRYKNTDQEKGLELNLTINEKKHFDLYASLTQQTSQHGFVYYPKLYLGINGERVVDLQGTLKLVSKKGISQYDVDLKFQTKRTRSKLFGYISKTEATIALNLKLDYAFDKSKEQRVIFKFSLANRSPKNLFVLRGTSSLFSTSYPNFNFDTDFSFQRGIGHIESKFLLTSSPLPSTHPNVEFHKLKLEWLFTFKSAIDSTQNLKTRLSIKRQSSGINLEGQFTYESQTPNVNVLMSVLYGDNKWISVSVFWAHPRTTLEEMEGRINITIPSFSPMILHGKLQEKFASHYNVEVSGSWFSGHNASAVGFFLNKSTIRALNLHFKFILKSPSFQDCLTSIHFYRTEKDLKVDFKADFEGDNYGLYLKHTAASPEEINTLVNLIYKTKLYSMSSHIYQGDHRRVDVELHLDQLRDIHFAAWKYSKEAYKAAGFEVKWDANRDNNQKLVVSGNFTKGLREESFNYNGNLLVSYPGRTIVSNYDFVLKNGHFYVLARLSWADKQTFAAIFQIDYNKEQLTYFSVKSLVATPFEGWQKTEINAGYHHERNIYSVNGSIFWRQDQHVSFELFEDHSMSDDAFECKLKSSLTSTLSHIPTLSAILNHSQNTSKVNTFAKLMYAPEHLIDLKSSWRIEQLDLHTNLTGTITVTTPFNVCRRGYLISKIHYTKSKYLRGYGDLDLDNKKFTVDLEGKFQKLTNSMLSVNVSTPMEKYKQLEGRFGFSEERRHLVAQITYPLGMVGFEILLEMEAITNFDIKLSLATPMSFLKQIFVVGKLKHERADFRIGWNSIILGFTGVWHYVNILDCEYSYKIYTPIEGFEENSIVATLILKDGLDFEVSIRLSQNKLGLAISGQPKPEILKELGIKAHTIYGHRSNEGILRERKTVNDDSQGETSEDDEDESYEENPLNWSGFIEIDTAIYPTMKGTLDIDQKGTLYITQLELFLPHGKATMVDEFEFIDTTTVKNELKIITPYPAFNTITSLYNLDIIPGVKYELELNLNYLNRTIWVNTGFSGLYTTHKNGENDKNRIYNGTVQVYSPFALLPKLSVRATHNIEANILYRTDLSVTTNNSDISVTSRVEIFNKLFDAIVFLKATVPTFEIPPTNIHFKREMQENDNFIETRINIEKILKKDIYLRLNYLFRSLKQFHTFIQFETPYKGFEQSVAGIKMSVTDKGAEAWTTLKLHPLEIDVNSTLSGNVLRGTSNINFNRKSFPIELIVNILPVSPVLNRNEFQGELLLKDNQFTVKGHIDAVGKMPIDAKISLIPIDGSAPLIFEYNLQTNGDGRYEITGSGKHSEKFTNFKAHLTIKETNGYFNLDINTSHLKYNHFIVQGNATLENNINRINIEAQTPIPKLENPKFGASLRAIDFSRHAQCFFKLTEAEGDIVVDWTYIFLENMTIKAIGSYKNTQYESQSQLEAFYLNPSKAFKFIKAGGEFNVDTLWSAGSNITLSIPNYQNIRLEAHVKLPDPIKEVYSLEGNLGYDQNFSNAEYLAKYYTTDPKSKYGSWGNISLANKTRMGGNLELEWNNKRINNYLDLQKLQNTWNILYKLRTPKFEDKVTLVTEMMYTSPSTTPYHVIRTEVFYPENKSFAFAKIDYEAFGNMNGTLNCTIPYKNYTYGGSKFTTKTNMNTYKRYLELFWPEDNVIVDCNSETIRGVSAVESNTTGRIIIEVPLTTRHIANVDFDYKKWLQHSTGHTTVDYNGNKVLEGKYNCLSESRGGLDKDTIHVEVRNKLVPVGADYVHGYEYGAPRDGFSAPTVDEKHLHLYHLTNLTKFNISGNVHMEKSDSGRKIALSATHSNRTVRLLSDYDVIGQQLKHKSRLELNPTTWIEYDFRLVNRTVDDIFDSQEVQIDMSYPRRSFTGKASYNVSESAMSTDFALVWDKDNKTVQAGLDWKRDTLHREEILLKIKHPSFEKDVTVHGEYEYDDGKLFESQLTIDYSPNINQLVKLGARLNNNCQYAVYNYSYNIWAQHDATSLKLNTYGDVYWRPRVYSTGHYSHYKRSYLTLQIAEALARADLQNYEIELKKIARHELAYFWTKYDGEYPTYSINVTTSHEMNNSTGEFYLNLDEKLVKLKYNMTTDGDQSINIYGFIPDARSASFDIWRDYEDIRVSDVAYYLRLNHSRLITSSLLWRPDLKQDVQVMLRSSLGQVYNNIIEEINNTKQYVGSETYDAMHGIWCDAKPLLEQFLKDLENLKVIDSDIDALKQFLNECYEANEFYIKDIVTIIMILFDDLALKSHFESLPAVVTEIWELMGEVGQKIKKSILWVAEKIKTYYLNTTDFIRSLLKGDPIDHLSKAFKNTIEKYDAFIKDLHVAFIKNMELLWSQTYAILVDNWHKTLAAIEPAFLTIVHHLETIAWNTSREFLDFLYIRKSEIIESPYFARFANFTQDLDRFYKDMTGNNTIIGVVKYTKIVWNFLKEKYFDLVPFGKEIQQIFAEIWAEVSELRNLPLVVYVESKWNEVYSNIMWLYDYFDMDSQIQHIMTMIHAKLNDFSQTALQADNKYRVAKTKFIFEPSDGIMLLEQKLPMSWHAFNETPKFQEVPELQTIYKIHDFFVTSRLSFLDFYYDYMPYTELSEWLPPFKAQALLIGSRYYVTFDRKYYDFQGGCSYLLATDNVNRNFSIAVSYNKNSTETHELILLINNIVVRVNVLIDSVRINNNEAILPMQIGNIFLYRENEIFTAKSPSDFLFECNMKFDVCVFKVSGWYFGKTAGLLGTINNEPTDDFLTSNRTIAHSPKLNEFTKSWTLGECTEKGKIIELDSKLAHLNAGSKEISLLCDEFFISKLSQLSSCFPRVSNEPFLAMCLNSLTEKEACTSVLAYINLCAFSNTPLRIPDVCVKCNSLNGTQLNEGQLIRLDGHSLPNSADIVFIIEAKDCNKNLRETKNFDFLIESIHKELTEAQLTENRYSIVVFGGDGAFDTPRSLVANEKIFTDAKQILLYLDAIQTGNGSSDIFSAITFAKKLLFRPGVSQNFILMPCSECRESFMKLDYAIIHQLLVESDVTLHILMNEEFSLPKKRETKIPFGIDMKFAYTKKDTRELIGDVALKKQVGLPKSTLGYCLPLAMETNGTVFSSKELRSDKRENVRKFASVFAKRMAATARPTKCVECECTAHNSGVSFMDCYPCTYPIRANIDSGFNEDDAIFSAQLSDDIRGSFERRR